MLMLDRVTAAVIMFLSCCHVLCALNIFASSAVSSLLFVQPYQLNTIFSTIISLETLPLSVNIPEAVSKKYPLPQEQLMTSYNRGNVFLTLGRFEDALREFNTAADISPTTADVFLSRGIVNEKLLRWNEAIEDYRHANELYRKRPFSGDDAVAFSNLANAETGLELWDDALRDYTYACSLKSDFIAPQLGRAFVLYQKGLKNESIQYFKSISVKYPLFADAQAALAVMLFENGDIEGAKDHWEDALEQDSRYQDVDWVENIRRWPPTLVSTLRNLKKGIAFIN